MAARVAILAETYGAVVEGNELVLPGGARFVIEDGRAKSHDAALADADIADMLEQVYLPGACGLPPPPGMEPGRVRHEGFFRAVYGGSAAAVEARLRPVEWFGQRLRVTSAMGVDAALARVRERLDPALARFLVPSAGTFNWRVVAGTDRLSVHSFGAAIDLNTEFANYWRWGGAWENRYPMEIVAAFEAEGFIWGGRWAAFDTMHFEYRPELIAIGRAAGGCR